MWDFSAFSTPIHVTLRGQTVLEGVFDAVVAQSASGANIRYMSAPSHTVVFHLTSHVITLTATTLEVRRRIETSSAATPARVKLSDISGACQLRPASRFYPGALVLPEPLPTVAVMPQRRAAAELLVELLQRGSEADGFFHEEAQFVAQVLPWLSQRSKGIDGIQVATHAQTLSGAGETPLVRAAESHLTAHSTPGVADSTAAATTVAASDVARPLAEPGSSLRPAASFVAFDVETANGDSGSIIQLGAAVVENGEISHTYSWLCRPPKGLEYFDENNIAVHGFTPSDVANEPEFATQLEKFLEVVGGRTVVAHNARFDFTALARACRAAGVRAPKLSFACTYVMARQLQLGLRNLKLPTLAQAAGAELDNHHDAAADAAACAEIALWLMQLNHVDSLEELAAQMSLAMGSIGSGALRQMRYDPNAATSGTSTSPTSDTSTTAGAAGANSNSSAPRRNPKWDAAKTPDTIPEPNPDADPAGLLFGQRVTLTGDFAPFDKGFLWEKIAEAGANINKGVTKKTTILVAGPWEKVTSKEKRARELQEQGQEIEIWSEKQLFDVLGLEAASES